MLPLSTTFVLQRIEIFFLHLKTKIKFVMFIDIEIHLFIIYINKMYVRYSYKNVITDV